MRRLQLDIAKGRLRAAINVACNEDLILATDLFDESHSHAMNASCARMRFQAAKAFFPRAKPSTSLICNLEGIPAQDMRQQSKFIADYFSAAFGAVRQTMESFVGRARVNFTKQVWRLRDVQKNND